MSFIEVECNNCQKTHKIPMKNFSFELVDSCERQMGAELTYEGSIEIECECGSIIKITHTFWEYPEGTENHSETTVAGGSLID